MPPRLSSSRLRLIGLLIRRHRQVLLVLLCVHAALLAYSAAIHSPVVDEPAHLAAGLSHWTHGDFTLYRVNPPLVRLIATAPLLRSAIEEDWTYYTPGFPQRREHTVGDDFVRANGSRIFWYMTVARWTCIPFSLVGAIACYAWARMLFCRIAGLAAAALWCFSPTALGHGALITPDAAGAAMGLAACLVFARWLVAPSWRLAVLSGLLLGVAESCKSTWIILFVLFPLVWVVWRVLPKASSARPTALQLAAIVSLGWLLLLAMYGFAGVGTPLAQIPFQSRLFTELLCEIDVRGKATVRQPLAAIPVPLPADYVIGLDQQRRDLEGPNRNYLRGVWRGEGWWYYYLYGLGVKETVGALLMAALSATAWGVTLSQRRNGVSRLRRRHIAASLLVAVCPIAVLVIASANTGMNHHVRYVMPVLPFLYILGAGLFSPALPWSRWRFAVGAALLVSAAISSLWIFPHSLSYFNEFAGGPAGGIHHLNNSNIDWGQDLLLLRDWQRKHAPGEPIHLAYFGRVNPIYAGIEYRVPPQRTVADLDSAELPVLVPGWYAVSVTLLQGRGYLIHTPDARSIRSDENAYGYFRQVQAVDRVGYSIYILQVE